MYTIKLQKENRTLVRPGMFWYEGDVISMTLDPSKQLKSIVLFADEQAVYGDSFMVRFGIRKNINIYMKEMLSQLRKRGLTACEPMVDDLHEVFVNKTLINARLREAKKLPWNEEEWFWVKSTTPKIVNLDEWSVRDADAYCTAYIRLMIVHRL